MSVKGIFTSDAGALQERAGSFEYALLTEERGAGCPLTAISAGMPNTTCNDTSVTWYEEGLMHTRCAITNITNPVGSLINVEDASWLHENMILIVETTGEYLMILGISGNTLTVQRGMSGTTVTPITMGNTTHYVQLIGTAFEEAPERPTGIAVNPYPRNNIVQILRSAWDISGTAQAVATRMGNRLEKNKQAAAQAHAEHIEKTLIWGRRHIGHVNGKPFRLMDGILAQMRSNIFVSSPEGLTRRILDDYIERLFDKNIKGKPNERITFGGSVAVRAINEIAWRYGTYNIGETTSVFGIEVVRYKTTFGSLSVIVHPLMQGSPVWSSELYSLHPSAMEMMWLRPTFHQDGDENGKASNLRDGTAGVFTSELTVKYGMEATGAIMTDVKIDHYDPCNPCPTNLAA